MLPRYTDQTGLLACEFSPLECFVSAGVETPPDGWRNVRLFDAVTFQNDHYLGGCMFAWC